MSTESAAMNVYDDTWELNEGGCPCDLHFIDFLADRKIVNASVFHMGTGAHHVVGARSAENGSNNAVIGITASPGEYERYIKLSMEKPEVSRSYKAFFGDIYQLDARLLPPLDVVSLFHLCEFRTEKNDAYGALTDLEVAKLLTDKLKPGGRILFYTKSMSFDKAEPVIAELLKQRPLKLEGDFKLLRVYRKAGQVAPSAVRKSAKRTKNKKAVKGRNAKSLRKTPKRR